MYQATFFGPLLVKTTVDQSLINVLLEEGNKTDLDMRPFLAGVLDKELRYTDQQLETIVPLIGPYIEQYIEQLKLCSHHSIDYCDIDFETIWINYQYPGNYNPLHSHNRDISFVIYCDIPEAISQEEAINKAPRPGAISFYDGTTSSYGDKVNKFLEPIRQVDILPKTGDMFIFPAYLNHCVQAFKSDVVRISVSGNVRLLNVT